MAIVYGEKKKRNPGKSANILLLLTQVLTLPPLKDTMDTFFHAFLVADKDIIQELDAKVKEDRKSASPKSLYYAGLFLWLLGRNDKAREYTERMIKLSNGSREVSFVPFLSYASEIKSLDVRMLVIICRLFLVFFVRSGRIFFFSSKGIILKAWIDVTSGKDTYARKAGKYFDEGLKERADVFGLMGKVRRDIQIHPLHRFPQPRLFLTFVGVFFPSVLFNLFI